MPDTLIPISKPKHLLVRYPNDEHPVPLMTPRQDIPWEAGGVFNPAVVKDGDIFRMLYRTHPGTISPTRRRFHRPGFLYHGRISRIGYAESRDGIHFTPRPEPFIAPDADFDRCGCEDPRITKIGDTFFITYTAIDNSAIRPNIRIALATTKDFITVTKHGIIGPPTESKAAAFFPDPVNGGRVGLALTISSDSTNSHVAVRYYDSIESLLDNPTAGWETFLSRSTETALLRTHWWLHRGPELGASPIRTDRGWLFIFSTESMSSTWTISAALADLDEPHCLIARTPSYLLQPVTDYEMNGVVPNVTFPSGAVIINEDLYVYYGGGDTVIGLATCTLDGLLTYLESFKTNESVSEDRIYKI